MKFRKKPVVIDAVKWTGENDTDVILFLALFGDSQIFIDLGAQELTIPTLEGDMTASAGDWIIRGVHGEFYPCKPDIFKKTYDAVDEDVCETGWY